MKHLPGARMRNISIEPRDRATIDAMRDHKAKPFLMIETGASYQETADRFGLPTGTIKSRVHRARLAIIAGRGGE